MVYRVIFAFIIAGFIASCSNQPKNEVIIDMATRIDRDAARERIQANVMRTQPVVRFDPDVEIIRNIAKDNNTNSVPAYLVHKPHLPNAQLFTGKEVSLQDAVSLLALSINYSSSFDKYIDKEKTVILPSTKQSIENLVDTIKYQSQTNIYVLPEARLIMVTEKAKQQ